MGRAADSRRALKLGFNVSQATVAKYMARRTTRPHSPGGRSSRTTSSKSRPPISSSSRRRRAGSCSCSSSSPMSAAVSLHVAVTAHPTAAWTAQQLREAFPWEHAPRYLIHDRDLSLPRLGDRRPRRLGIEEVLTAPRSPWQNAYAERLIGSIRRECLDHVIIANARGLRCVLHAYVEYYLNPEHTSRSIKMRRSRDRPHPQPTATSWRSRTSVVSTTATNAGAA